MIRTRDKVIINLLMVIARGIQLLVNDRLKTMDMVVAYDKYNNSTVKMAKEYLGDELND